MADYTQAGRPLKVGTELGDDVLLLTGFSGEEAVSAPFRFNVDMLSADDSIDPDSMLRSPITLSIQLTGDDERVLHGLVNRFVQLGQVAEEGLTSYRAEVVPWFWFLSLSSECRIYQNKTVLEIAEQVFKDLGYSDFEFKCVKSYPKREFCVQYRETHLNFISRLLEEEGIFYFFQHSDSKHVLTLADDASAVKDCPVQSTVRVSPAPGAWQEEDIITTVQREHSAYIGKVTLRDYDYLQPSLQLEGSVSGEGVEEIYDYPGNFAEMDEGERLARLQLEGREAWHECIRGEGVCRSLQSGYAFELKNHYRKDMNQKYQLLSVRHSARAGDYRASDSAPFEYRNEFMAIPHSVPFRPPFRSRKPVVQGSQTALVVGKSGEEIWVDKHGRVKVQFYWDRVGAKDEKSSCWVRVSSTWAGKGWGFVQIPRIGQEVIVDFLEGDPDRPIITGRVYNAEQIPPYTLPGNQTQSGFKSRSSKSGGTDNFNEIRMEDLKGSEVLYIHAEKDEEIVVENDRTLSIGNDDSVTVGNNRSEQVEKNETVSIGKNEEFSVGENMSLSVGKNRTEDVGENSSTDVGKNMNVQVEGNSDLTINKTYTVKVKDDHKEEVEKGYSLKAKKKIFIESKDSIEIKTGSASIVMKKNGDIQIKGGNITVKGSGDVVLKGSKIAEN